MTLEKTRVGAADGAANAALRLLATFGPGVLLTGLLSAAAIGLADMLGGLAAMYALVLGLLAGGLGRRGTTRPGTELVTGPGLKIAIALLGSRISMETIAGLGVLPAILIALSIPTGVAFSVLLARRLGLGSAFGAVAGMAVAVCGVSAAFTTAAVLRPSDGLRRDTVLVALLVTLLSSAAMVAYPLLAAALRLDDTATGLLLGASIHDLAQVIGAGYGISTTAGDQAVLAKLLRIALLAPAVLGLVLLQGRQPGMASAPFPWFILAFGFVALWQTAGLIPAAVSASMQSASSLLFLAAITGVAIKTPLRHLQLVEPRKLLVVLIHTAVLLATATAAVCLIG